MRKETAPYSQSEDANVDEPSAVIGMDLAMSHRAVRVEVGAPQLRHIAYFFVSLRKTLHLHTISISNSSSETIYSVY